MNRMNRLKRWWNDNTETIYSALWIALCFGLTSAAYLSWLYRLVSLSGTGSADWLSMVAGYLLQAAGIALSVLILRRSGTAGVQRDFLYILILFGVLTVPAVLGTDFVSTTVFGLLMNLVCGMIGGFYLYGMMLHSGRAHRGVVFGGGYALASLLTALPALLGGTRLLQGGYAVLVYLFLTAAAAVMTVRMSFLQKDHSGCGRESGQTDTVRSKPGMPHVRTEEQGKVLLFAFVTVVLISLVKNLGFSFPSSDIEAGLKIEISRIAYAAGLAAAGLLTDKSRRNSAVCTLAALVLPFIMLGVTGEPVPSAICWGLDYFFFGFFSVYRVVLFLDLAEETGHRELAPAGLLAGRVGDAAGSAVSIVLTGKKLLLIGVTAVLFFAAVFAMYKLYQMLREPETVHMRSEQEVFEAFCMHNDLSAREREVLRMLLDNHSNGEIAEALFISENTVKYHVRNILQKTGGKNRTELRQKYTRALYPHLQEEHPYQISI